MNQRPLRVLLVSYAFPPVGGAGVQRVTKLTKYLPRQGVEASVLTSGNPSVPLRDASLGRDVPRDTRVIRAATLEPGYGAKQLAWQAVADRRPTLLSRAKRRMVAVSRRLLVPDPQVLWLPGAGRALLKELFARQPPDVLFISGPPFSQFTLALAAKLSRTTAVVLDYRDEWTLTGSSYEMSSRARLSEKLERIALGAAHAVTTATDDFKTALLARFPQLDPERVHTIPNGYDPDDFPEDLPSPSGRRFLASYVGTTYRLTSPDGFLRGLRLLHEREPALAKLLDVRFIGRVVDTELPCFEGSEALGVSRLGYLDHTEALRHLAQSHLALCIMSDVSGVERSYPGKIFEIMRMGRPCLVMAPEGACSALVRRHQLGEVVPPRDENAIAAALSRRLVDFRDGRPTRHAPRDIERFDRRRQAQQFAQVFRTAASLSRGRTAWSA